MKLSLLLNIIIVIALGYWVYQPKNIPVEVGECLHKLRGGLNQTMRNVIYGDNQNIGRINGRFVGLGMDVDAAFEQFALDYIGYMTLKEIRSYTASYVKFIAQHRTIITQVYSSQNLTHDVESIFQSLYDELEFLVDDELRPVRSAINNKPEAEKCWITGKVAICDEMKVVAAEIDEVLKYESRHYERVFERLLKSVEGLPEILNSSYRRCLDPRLEDHPEERKKCAAFSMRERSKIFSFEVSRVLNQISDYFHERNKGATMKVTEYFQQNLSRWRSLLDKNVLHCVDNYKQ